MIAAPLAVDGVKLTQEQGNLARSHVGTLIFLFKEAASVRLIFDTNTSGKTFKFTQCVHTARLTKNDLRRVEFEKFHSPHQLTFSALILLIRQQPTIS